MQLLGLKRPALLLVYLRNSRFIIFSASIFLCHSLFSQFAIMRNLDVDSLLSLSATCKQMHHLAFDNVLWLSLLKKDLWNGGECYHDAKL